MQRHRKTADRATALMLGLGPLLAGALLLIPLPAPVLDTLLLGNLLLAGVLLLAVTMITGEGGGRGRRALARRLAQGIVGGRGRGGDDDRARAAGGPLLRAPRFPALLTLSVLLRFGLTVAALRLLLVSGDAGWVVAQAADLCGRDARVALALILLLGTTQYLVLARGGERAAEVAARFALEALPGRQAAIEAELRAGTLTPAQGHAQRSLLFEEAQRYGSMDGALRLVRGDVIGGLLALVLALLFGTWLGAARDGLPLLAALEHATAQAAGLGLCTQVPVLLTTAAALLLLTSGGAAPGAARSGRRPGDGAALVISATPALVPMARAALRRAQEELGFALPARVQRGAETERAVLALHVHGVAVPEVRGAEDAGVLRALLRREAAALLGVDEVQDLLDALQRQRPALVRETVPRLCNLALLTGTLRQLLQDGVTPLPLAAALEALAGLALPATDPLVLAEQLRPGLSQALLRAATRDAAPGRPLPVMIVDAELEELLRESLRGAAGREALALELELLAELRAAVAAGRSAAPGAVVLCQPALRRPLQRLLAANKEGALVLSYGDLPAHARLRPCGRLTPSGFQAAEGDDWHQDPGGDTGDEHQGDAR